VKARSQTSNERINLNTFTCGLYYKPILIVNDDSSIVNKLETSLTDDARVIIYDHLMFIVCNLNLTFNKVLKSYLLFPSYLKRLVIKDAA
jgi:hypothetical protein